MEKAPLRTSAQQLGSLVRSARDIMRKDKGLNGDLDRLPMLTWVMFLKFLDDMEQMREQAAVLAGGKFKPAIEAPYRWRDWAAKEDGVTGPELISFINNEEATRPDGTKGPGLFAYLRGLQGTNGGDRRDVIRSVFAGTVNRMINGYLLRDVVNKINGIHFNSTDEIHTLGRLYESLLKEMRDAAGDSGEFYTPRAVVRFMVEVTDPRLGETVLDPACDTGGFLVEAYAHLEKQCKTVQDRRKLQDGSIVGGEAKSLPYLLAQMNLLLHGLEYPRIGTGNSLEVKITEIGDEDRVDVVLTNPPFGGEEERGILNNFPADKRTSERGLDFYGRDINPLAVLLCRVKSGPFFLPSLKKRAIQVQQRIDADQGQEVEVRFRGLHKWFRKDVAIRLSRIARAVRAEEVIWSRRFFWIAIAETVRLVSNSRTSTYKLHIRPAEEVRGRQIDPVAVFNGVVRDNLAQLAAKHDLLSDMGKLEGGRYSGQASVDLGDSSSKSREKTEPLFDLMITSPPYGDNVSTVPYGQHSFLPLQWMDLGDIDECVDPTVLATTHTIDSRSLGGSRRNALADAKEVLDRSPSLRSIIEQLPETPKDNRTRVAAFFRDLDRSIDPILSHLRPNAYMFWIVGDRRVAKNLIPLQAILTELLCHRKAVLVTTLERRILSKRMAVRNSVAQTMRTETILVMRKV